MTRLMVLGLLTYKSMSGYEMQTHMQMSQTDKWAGILPGSIYHALKKMEAEGLVRVEQVEHTGHRTKAIYSITEAGRAELMQLLQHSLTVSSVQLPTTLYTAISFLHMLSPDIATAAVSQQIRQVEADLVDMKAGQSAKEAATLLPEYITLCFEHIYEQHEMQLRFLHKLQDCLTRMPANPNKE
ncbi:PadR family transcriptional regulator [Paenibacillus sp. 481]|uniref:PadR family transcriptional regulator n=1 Tax=Paenibacillus sp. 481 TaxID=2835869 RepID=UPI001E362DCA|nr:PadR family transcriptional regulator [Paenibacillus sp. 481]UHA75095.1 PadR family transcriptional regulator [Paenibacillus sp. 481]